MNKLSESIEVLIDITIDTDNLDSVEAAIYENKDKVAKALQFIGDANFESYIHIAHQTLWKVCPSELEEHVMGCAHLYTGIISNAWNEYETDCNKALNDWFDETKDSEDKDASIDVSEAAAYFEKCFEAS